MIFLNIKCLSKIILSFVEAKIIYLKLLTTKFFYSVQGMCLKELWILWVLRPGSKGSSSSIQLNCYSITFLHLHWNLYKLARTLITRRLQGKKLFQAFSRSVDLGSIKKKSQRKRENILKNEKLVFFKDSVLFRKDFFFFLKRKASLAIIIQVFCMVFLLFCLFYWSTRAWQ